MILAGFAPRKWVDRNSGVVQERTVLWLRRTDVQQLTGDAFEEVMVKNVLLPHHFKLGDDIVIIRNSSGFVQQILNLNELVASAKSK